MILYRKRKKPLFIPFRELLSLESLSFNRFSITPSHTGVNNWWFLSPFDIKYIIFQATGKFEKLMICEGNERYLFSKKGSQFLGNGNLYFHIVLHIYKLLLIGNTNYEVYSRTRTNT